MIQFHRYPTGFVFQDASIHVHTDNENEIDLNRTIGATSSEDTRQQQLLNYVANRVSVHCKFDERRLISSSSIEFEQ